MTKPESDLAAFYAAALEAVVRFEEAAAYEEALWTGWGDQMVPPQATTRRVKANQALAALRDADPRSSALIEAVIRKLYQEREPEWIV